MSGLIPSNPGAAVSPSALDGLAATWICLSCGRTRTYEGGRPGGRDECAACGCRVATPPQPGSKTGAASTSRYLF